MFKTIAHSASAAYTEALRTAHDRNLAVANEAAITALTISNGLSEQQSFAAAMWAEVKFEEGR